MDFLYTRDEGVSPTPSPFRPNLARSSEREKKNKRVGHHDTRQVISKFKVYKVHW